MAKIKTGKEIHSFEDVERLVLFLCKTKNNYTIEDIYNLTQEKLVGSRIVLGKRLYIIIETAVKYLISKEILQESDGVYTSKPIKFVQSFGRADLLSQL